jgi:hypothetical protein
MIMNRASLASALVFVTAFGFTTLARAQASLPNAAPASYPPAALDRIVAPIALYPDPLLAQLLAAATYPSDIPAAAAWANDHRSFTGNRLADAIAADRVPWDPSVQALLPFPTVLDMMAHDMPWTEELGNAVLMQRAEVMASVQRLRHQALSYGYIQSPSGVTVTDGPFIQILPADAAYIPVPYYDPLVVFAPPRPGIVVRTAINYRVGVRLGAVFAPWGWGTTWFEWPRREVIINRVPWQRAWTNRATYVHPYAVQRYAGPVVEKHHVTARSESRPGRDVRGRR